MSPLHPLALALLLSLGGAAQAQQAPPRPDPAVVTQLTSSWEVLWHQSGMPTRVARWSQPIRYRVTGLPADRANIDRALADVTQAAGVPLMPSDQQPNLTVEIVPDTALEDREPCVSTMSLDVDTQEIDGVVIRMRQHEVQRCIYHEAMHAMGLRGHPSGPTNLSYFNHDHDRLLPLDKIMLRAWYSPSMKTGMSPLEAMPVLADEVVCAAEDAGNALRLRDMFLDLVVGESKRYAAGQGDVPSIIKKSGKASETAMTRGRTAMSLYLSSNSQPSKPFSGLQCKSALNYSSSRSITASNR